MTELHSTANLSPNYARVLHGAIARDADPVAAARMLRLIYEGYDDRSDKERVGREIEELGSAGLLAAQTLKP